MKIRRNRWINGFIALATAAALTACSSSSGGSGSGPIKIGAIYTATGSPYNFESLGIPKMVSYMFDQLNARGGINGRKVDFSTADDTNTPAGASQVARELIQQDGVVALVGGASFVSCRTNSNFYKQQNIYSVEAIQSDSSCSTSARIAATNPGPFVAETLMMKFAAEKLGLKRQCALMLAGPYAADEQAASDEYEKLTGLKTAYTNFNVPTSTTDFTPYLLQAKAAGCQSIFNAGGPQQAPALARQLVAQGMKDVTVLNQGGTDTPAIGAALQPIGVANYVSAEFAPVTTTSADMDAYLAAAKSAGVQAGVFTQGAYLSALYAITVLKSIKGAITRESVSRAFENMKPISNAMTSTPFVMGKADSHAANTSIQVEKLQGGSWVLATTGFLTVAN